MNEYFCELLCRLSLKKHGRKHFPNDNWYSLKNNLHLFNNILIENPKKWNFHMRDVCMNF